MAEDEAVRTDDRNIATGGPDYCVPSKFETRLWYAGLCSIC